jgi:hypothetical protein
LRPNISTDFFIEDISARRVESLADQDWLENEKNAIVAKMANITMTTISSTNVKADLHPFIFS